MILNAHNSLNAALNGVTDIPELLARLKAHAKTLPPTGAWLEGMGCAVRPAVCACACIRA